MSQHEDAEIRTLLEIAVGILRRSEENTERVEAAVGQLSDLATQIQAQVTEIQTAAGTAGAAAADNAAALPVLQGIQTSLGTVLADLGAPTTAPSTAPAEGSVPPAPVDASGNPVAVPA